MWDNTQFQCGCPIQFLLKFLYYCYVSTDNNLNFTLVCNESELEKFQFWQSFWGDSRAPLISLVRQCSDIDVCASSSGPSKFKESKQQGCLYHFKLAMCCQDVSNKCHFIMTSNGPVCVTSCHEKFEDLTF